MHGEIGLCVLGVRVSVWMESHGCDSEGRLGGICVEAEMGVCVCVCVCVEGATGDVWREKWRSMLNGQEWGETGWL